MPETVSGYVIFNVKNKRYYCGLDGRSKPVWKKGLKHAWKYDDLNSASAVAVVLTRKLKLKVRINPIVHYE